MKWFPDPLDDEVDDLAGDEVGDSEEYAGEDHEPEGYCGALPDLLAVGPAHALEFLPGGAEEPEGAKPSARADFATDDGAARVGFELRPLCAGIRFRLTETDRRTGHFGVRADFSAKHCVFCATGGFATGCWGTSGRLLSLFGISRVFAAPFGAAITSAIVVTSHSQSNPTSGSPDEADEFCTTCSTYESPGDLGYCALT